MIVRSFIVLTQLIIKNIPLYNQVYEYMFKHTHKRILGP